MAGSEGFDLDCLTSAQKPWLKIPEPVHPMLLMVIVDFGDEERNGVRVSGVHSEIVEYRGGKNLRVDLAEKWIELTPMRFKMSSLAPPRPLADADGRVLYEPATEPMLYSTARVYAVRVMHERPLARDLKL
jgi:hypothetical protein